MITLQLDEDQYTRLMLALGMAAGVAMRDGFPSEPFSRLARELELQREKSRASKDKP